ncbi:MAG TPA: phage tail sheath C-terminal domain-containing protein [Acidimicrobiales bacterium]
MEPIAGVDTSTAGFVGEAPAGPVGEARLVTSMVEFTELYGGLEPLGDARLPYLAYAARAFFLNGGRRLYVARVGEDGLPGALDALAREGEIALVAAPGVGAAGGADGSAETAAALIAHAEAKGRFALVDGPEGSTLDDIRRFRARFDSDHAALYHPWVVGEDSLGSPNLPPSGFVAGVFARGHVLKPASGDAVEGAARLESAVDREAQAVLNPEGISVLRSFAGEGIRVWGARTMSSDPEWKYVNIRRYLLYLERSLDQGIQWAVFEPNGEGLWASVRGSIDDFLQAEWRAGRLMGRQPKDAFFVRCDRTTMTQDDIDHGRLIVLVGVAPLKPAEFVIFRIGQWTADATDP